MLRFINKLLRDFKTTNSARSGRRAPRRAMLQVEGLEDRMLLSTATLNPNGTLSVVVDQPSQQITFTDDKSPGKLDVVLGKNTLLGQFPIASVTQVRMTLTSSDTVTVNYSQDGPFQGGTNVFFSGSGSGNSLTLTGSTSGGETFNAGNAGSNGGLNVGSVIYPDLASIGSITDSVKITGTLSVVSSGANVSLTGNGVTPLIGTNGVTQTLSGLNPVSGGLGNSLTYSNKNSVVLSLFSNNGSAVLNASAAAAGEQSFEVDLFGSNQALIINATPRTVATTVKTFGQGDQVNLFANSGPVTIKGDSVSGIVKEVPPHVILGRGTGSTEVTSGINANVSVEGAATLIVADFDNTATQENVKVTEKTISGTGLFGNPLVQVNYRNVGHLDFDTGALASGKAESYTIEGSSASAKFTTPIEIDDFAKVGLSVQVNLTAASDLNLNVENAASSQAGLAKVDVHARGATFKLKQGSAGGFDTVTFGAPNTTSTIEFEANNGNVTVHNFNN